MKPKGTRFSWDVFGVEIGFANKQNGAWDSLYICTFLPKPPNREQEI